MNKRAGRRKQTDVEPGRVEPPSSVEGDGVLRVARVVGPREHDDARTDEAREVVDVATRLVVHDSVAEPDHALDPEMVAQAALDLGSRQ